MNTEVKTLGDAEFVAEFENQTLDPVHFDHRGHVRLAWLYLNRYDLEAAIAAMCAGLQAYAASLGAKDKFHVTITDALMRIMAKRIEGMREKSWCLFLAENADLMDDALSVLRRYFSSDRLLSEEARVSRVLPDIRAI